MSRISLPILERPETDGTQLEGPLAALARSLTNRVLRESHPQVSQVHLVTGGAVHQLFVVNGSRLYNLPAETADSIRSKIEARDEGTIDRMLSSLGLDMPLFIDDHPLTSPPLYALSLAIAQKCNLGCTYCYAQQGDFGGPAKNMSLETACQAVDVLLRRCSSGNKVNLAFLGGEPLVNRDVLRQATHYAATRAKNQSIELQCSITTNGTLLTEEDADFFEKYGFAVTISLDGSREEHNRLRPYKSGAGSFDHILTRVQPLLERQRRMQVSARVTVTPHNLNLPATLELFIGLGFHSVGFSPLLYSSNSQNEMDADHLRHMLEAMIACGLVFEQKVLAGERYPFLNMINALRELQRGTHRPYPCGAGAGYFGVSADGDLAACHRFVGDADGAMGDVTNGVNQSRQSEWLASRHVHFQQPCNGCWARYLCSGGCHHEVLARGRSACDYIRSWLHYTMQAYERLSRLKPQWYQQSTHEAGAP